MLLRKTRKYDTVCLVPCMGKGSYCCRHSSHSYSVSFMSVTWRLTCWPQSFCCWKVFLVGVAVLLLLAQWFRWVSDSFISGTVVWMRFISDICGTVFQLRVAVMCLWHSFSCLSLCCVCGTVSAACRCAVSVAQCFSCVSLCCLWHNFSCVSLCCVCGTVFQLIVAVLCLWHSVSDECRCAVPVAQCFSCVSLFLSLVQFF